MFKYTKIKNLSIFYLLGIIILGFLLRVVFLGSIPNGFFPDEASNAYDAYSIINTLRDQYGEFLPAYFRSANDYREGLYIYLIIPFIKIFGLNIFGSRITSAVIGTLTVFVLYYLTKEIFSQRIALFSALFLAISPWHIQFSRITFRAILFPLLFCITLLIFLKSLKTPKLISVSGLLFAISIYTFYSARVFVPLFMIGSVIVYRQYFIKHTNQTILALILFAILFIPQFIYQLSPQGMARANEVGILNNIPQIVGQYFSYFSPNYLFFKGDTIPRHTINNMGELYLFEIVTLILGVVGLIRNQINYRPILILWLFLYPIPAALVSPYSAVRTCVGAPLFAIISGYGMVFLLDELNGTFKPILRWTSLLIIFANFTIFTKHYFVDYPKLKSDAWLPTFQEVISEADNSKTDCILISDNIESKYVYILIPFYTKMPAAEYQKLNIDVTADRLDMKRWKIIDFEPYNQGNLPKIKHNLNNNCLYLLHFYRDQNVLDKEGYHWQDIKTFKTINGEQYYRLVKLIKD
ncbi:ArnT family glycosyltransferase [Cyanobacterium sp. uoEpiScrs1]|uniref:ArnT family glycosyltransferase n=1 Tax=Cyanobacterium sp. uoEpiScrs1 TaxID=2976343 RepID=UPI00226A0CCF|nr:glycosyltransferase family 39 protein [Cyanobacterium sp. uoEpiScrs1]